MLEHTGKHYPRKEKGFLFFLASIYIQANVYKAINLSWEVDIM